MGCQTCFGDSLAILRADLKSQKKHVRSLQKKSLWSKILEEVMEQLVDVVHFLHMEIHNAFGTADTQAPVKSNRQKLGAAGLALHYVTIITQIDTLEESKPAPNKPAIAAVKNRKKQFVHPKTILKMIVAPSNRLDGRTDLLQKTS